MTEYERCAQIWEYWRKSAPQEIESRLDNYHMLEAFHATKLEYSSLPFNVVQGIWHDGKIDAYAGAIQPLIALSNFHVQARLADLCIEQEIPLSTEVVSGLHHALSCGLFSPEQYVDHEERPGEFKHLDSVSGVFDVGTAPEEIEELIAELLDEMPSIARKNDTLVAATYLHARLLFLKPFIVMNNALAVATMNYWLRLEGHPPVVIPSAEITQYRKHLETFDLQDDLEPLAYYFSLKVAEFWGPQMGTSGGVKPRFTLRI